MIGGSVRMNKPLFTSVFFSPSASLPDSRGGNVLRLHQISVALFSSVFQTGMSFLPEQVRILSTSSVVLPIVVD